jgi:transcriptional regulator with GAF, ATPase, and Fis domain
MSDEPRNAAEGNSREEQIADTFVTLADTLVDDYDVIDLLDALIERCLLLFGATAAGILLIDQRGNLSVTASSSEETRLLEVFQIQGDEGPCLDCIRTAQPVTSVDLAAEVTRWPAFVPAALATGFRAVDAVPLRLRDVTIGGLNLFHGENRSLAPADRRVARALADVATIGILQQRSIHRSSLLAEQLQSALNSRIVIEQAKGVIAERHDVSFEQAFAALRRYSRDTNTKISETARSVVLHQLDPGEISRRLEQPGSLPSDGPAAR